jgi:DHA1 family bicyclomycin/chloramphenicol resistance-like MFS transporter
MRLPANCTRADATGNSTVNAQVPNGAVGIPGFRESITLIAAFMAAQALAIDAMLPALPSIARALDLVNENRSQWVISSYVVGLGIGQLFWGLLSDRFGRRPVLIGGLALYTIAAILCSLAASFTALLAWRCMHGLAAASMVVARSVIRDLYSGRSMARVMSLTFIVFLIVPSVAPSIGQLILMVAPWRHIFMLFGAFGALVGLWAALRLPETLHPEYRMTLSVRNFRRAAKLVLTTRMSICYTLAQTLLLGSLMSYIGTIQQIVSDVYHRDPWMPTLFALSAVAMGCTSYLNSRVVERVGMRFIAHTALLTFVFLALLQVSVATLCAEPLWAFVFFQSASLASFGLAISNFGAIAMEPLGAVAGVGASLQGFISQFISALIGALIGRQFHGTTVPLAVGTLCCSLGALLFALLAENGRLFRPHNQHLRDALTAGIDTYV